ncbi:MAG: diguanylate cyclase, partial [Bryobacteraceae bacterium]
MIGSSDRPEAEIAEPQEIRQSLIRLDRSTSWFRWNTIVVLILLLAALAALSAPELLGRYALPRLGVTVIVRGLLALMLISNSYTLYHHRQFKLFRHRLAEQMQIAVTQRMRADKFYGLAILDPLTGLYNRRVGEVCLRKEITRAERHRYDLAVILLDLDRLNEL